MHQGIVKRNQVGMLANHRSGVIWFTGLPGAGKSTLAMITEANLMQLGFRTCLLDGDLLRQGLNRDLGFGRADRAESVRRTSEVAKLMTNAGLVAICALVSPFHAERQFARQLLGEDFIEVFVDTPLEICVERDPKNIYRRALRGELTEVTGIDQAYQPPETPELVVRTTEQTPHVLAEAIVRFAVAKLRLKE
ncbi:adenylyl-sulfate kinase [Methylocystis sp. IM3]|uniref:adenylyl-sulfate kinase n=1 Tax=unclassified Methylocystis TaxID=2625913 RepID=UPI0030FBE570